MTSVDPASRLAALMRAQVASLRGRYPLGKARKAEAHRSSASGDPPDVATSIVRRLKALDRDDPQRAHAAVRIYLESVLLAELGPHLANDPAFALMVDQVHELARSDSHLAGMLDQAAAILLGAVEAPEPGS